MPSMSALEEMVAGMGSVHGCIGAVDPLKAFGTPEQKQRFLPRLASGEARSAFALTEPCAGSDLTALRTTAVEVGDHFEVTGEKLFITNCLPGRTIGLVVMLKGQPAVLIAELPPHETDEFQIVPYGLYALRRGYNNGLRFNNFRVPQENLLVPPQGDGLTIAYHGLNLGRVAVCAGAAGTMRVMLASMLPWAEFRRTYGQPIATRELVKRRIARLAGLIAGCDALVAWCSWLIDEGYRGELECIVAKIFGSESLKEAAVELFMKTHGGRSFLDGHLFGDNVHDLLAPCIYEGEGEMLGMAFFKSLVKEHGKAFFEPIGKRLQEHKMRTLSPMNPVHLWRLRRELWSYGKWKMGQKFTGSDRQPVAGLQPDAAEARRFRPRELRPAPQGDQRGDGEAPAEARRPAVPHDRAVAARAGHDRDARDGAVGAPAEERGGGGRGGHPLPGPAPQAHRRAAQRLATSATSASSPTSSSRAASRRSTGVRTRRDPDAVREQVAMHSSIAADS